MSDQAPAALPVNVAPTNALLPGNLDEDLIFGVFGDYGLFVPKQEVFTESFLKWRRPRLIDPREFLKYPDAYASSCDEYSDSRKYVEPVYRHLAELAASVVVFDVGGYLGEFAIQMAQLARRNGWKSRVYCLEPGPTRPVIEHSVRVNRLEDTVTVLDVAAADVSGPALFSYEPGRAISGTLYNHNERFRHSACDAIALDELARKVGPAEAYLVKVDAGGWESTVFSGMLEMTREFPTVIVASFMPWSLARAVGNRRYVDFLAEHIIVDIKSSLWPRSFTEIPTDSFFDFARALEVSDESGTDLLLIPRDLSGAAELLDKFKLLSGSVVDGGR